MDEVKDTIVYLGARIYRNNRKSLEEITKDGKLYKLKRFKKTLRGLHQDIQRLYMEHYFHSRIVPLILPNLLISTLSEDVNEIDNIVRNL
jgi:hypothetical protein